MPRRPRRRSILPTGALLTLLLGMVIAPALLSLSVGIVALALWRQAFDIVFGVLVLCFAATAIAGGLTAIAFLRRSARLAELQTDFVANVSHELRTPLAGIRLLGETLEMGRAEEPEKRKEVIELLLADVARLEHQVERLLRWRRLDAGAAELEREPLRPADLVAEVVEPYATPRGGAEARFELQLDDGLPTVVGDRAALADALRNLVDNAVKFGGDRGAIEVSVRSDGDDVLFEVRDQGPGIPRRDRKQVFERFYRVGLHPRSKQGLGLGLSIAQGVVAAHGGRIRVDSEPGLGTAVSMWLPAARESS